MTASTIRTGELSPALQMRRAAMERRAQDENPKRQRAIVTFIVVCVVGVMLIAGAYLSMSELRSGAWEKPSTTQGAPSSVTTESTTPVELTTGVPAPAPVSAEPAPVATPVPAPAPVPVEAPGGYVPAPVTP